MRKRSSRVGAFLATVAIAPLGINMVGCAPEAPPAPPPVQAPVYASIEQCKTAETNDALCDQAFAGARAQHAANAPTFSRQAECERQFGAGNCETKQTRNADGSISDVIIPAMAGFMLANAMSDMGGGYDRRDRRDYGPSYTPIYYGTNGGVYSGRSQIATLPRGSSVPMARVSTNGFANGQRATVPARPQTISVTPSRTGGFAAVGTTSRGGFGATASGRGGGG